MQTEEVPSRLAALPAQIIILAVNVRSDIEQAMESDNLDESRALLERAVEAIGVIVNTAADAQLPEEVVEAAT
ncbi:MAG: hypothetical protein ACLQFI_05045 [Methylocella sp.]